MPQPQPGADRPADGDTPDPHRDRDPAVTEEATPSPVPSGDEPRTGPEGTRELDTDEPEAAGRPTDGPHGTRALPADEPEPAAEPAVGPQGTRALPADEPEPAGQRSDEQPPEPPAPKWSGSAAVPPPPPRKRGWGESAEPTPAPPSPLPEHQAPVDPWAGADTGGWELPSAEMPHLPPTLPYPAPPTTRPYSGPPAPPAMPYQVSPPPVAYPAPPQPVGYPAPPAYPQPAPRPAPTPLAPALPPARPKQKKKGRGAPPPTAPPPGWQAPKGYVPVPVRRRRRWPWLLLLTLACCCGCPAWFGVPMATQYPATAALPAQVADLRLREDSRSTQTARELEAQVRAAHWLAEDTFAGVYTTPTGKRVTVFGGTGFRFAPESDADAEISRLREEYALGDAQVIDTDVRGRHERCAVGRSNGADVVVCTSVDHGSIATAVFTRLSLDDSAALLDELRTQIVTPQQS
ncbi:hypothetical protein [Micromonospora sp. NPDC049497]|uniref:hypothetical protein n=1 Tax=Micromonospora sp. NPDC049497 TaxID=3364273 RepID=UPI0037A7561A